MKIERMMHDPKQMILMMDDINIHFTDFEAENTGVRLLDGGRMTAYLYFEQATKFYKAWRAMK
jgi:hypothetical protein